LDRRSEGLGGQFVTQGRAAQGRRGCHLANVSVLVGARAAGACTGIHTSVEARGECAGSAQSLPPDAWPRPLRLKMSDS
jgi:hypothetical protein